MMSSKTRIYLDHAATTPMSPTVLELMGSVGSNLFGNPSSIHREGAAAKSFVEESRKRVAEYLNVSAGQLIFTSGGTESINAIVRSAAMDLGIRNFISGPIEHPAAMNSIKYYSEIMGGQHMVLPTDVWGNVQAADLDLALQKAGSRSLVSLIHTHNETGSIQDLEVFREVCQRHGALFLADTVQSTGTLPLDLSAMGMDFACGSAHKFNGPKGVGYLYLKNPEFLKPLLLGGGQERNLRASTENVMGIAGLAKAFEEAVQEMDTRKKIVLKLHHKLRSGLDSLDAGLSYNTPSEHFHPKILSVNFPSSRHSEYLLMNLDIQGIAASGGAACSSGSEKASHVLAHLRPGQEGKTIRFSISHLNMEEEIDRVIEVLAGLLKS